MSQLPQRDNELTGDEDGSNQNCPPLTNENDAMGDISSTSSAANSGDRNSILDCPVCLQPSVHPVELPCGHIFCFLCIKGVATQGGQQPRCAICRSNVPLSVLTNPKLKDISQLYKTDKSGGYQWYYESRSGGWWQYEERTVQELERAYEAGRPSCQLLIAGHMYDIDFSQMIQFRTGNHNLFRRMKRDLPGGDIRGIAGIRVPGIPSTQVQTGRHRSSGFGRNTSSSTISNGPIPISTFPDSSSTHSVNNGMAARISPTDSQQDVDDEDSQDEEEVFVDSDDDEDDMELGEEEQEVSETDEYNDELRDGARAPTSRSDRSTCSFNQTPPPCAGAGGTNSSRKNSKCSNRSTPPSTSTPTSASSVCENNTNTSPSSVSPPVPPSVNTSNVSSPIPSVQTVTTTSNGAVTSSIQIGPTLRITVDYNTNPMEEDEIL